MFQKEIEVPVVDSNARRWDALPKIIWLFWNKGISQASIGNRLCIENLRRSAEAAGFEVRELNNSNVIYYIGKELNARFDNVIKNRKIPTFPQTKSNFVRKAIIYKYGGIYMDVSYFSMQSLDWILNIARYPSQYIFNRYGEMPRMFMFFHPHYGQPFYWKYEKRGNTKRQDLTAYENNLIIAEPGHELLKEWIDEYALTITSDYKDTQERMRKYGVSGNSWTNPNDLYLTSMDSLKNVVGRRQKELEEKAKEKGYDGPLTANEYYGIWSMSGYRGQQKIRAHTNFDNNYYRNPQSSDNVFLYRYSQEYT
jgi:mannosyltransferase OCH1-like enzyme